MKQTRKSLTLYLKNWSVWFNQNNQLKIDQKSINWSFVNFKFSQIFESKGHMTKRIGKFNKLILSF